MKYAQYVKTYAALIGAILTSVSAVLPESPLWLTITLAIASAVAVFAFPNEITDAQRAEVEREIALRNTSSDGTLY